MQCFVQFLQPCVFCVVGYDSKSVRNVSPEGWKNSKALDLEMRWKVVNTFKTIIKSFQLYKTSTLPNQCRVYNECTYCRVGFSLLAKEL